MSYNVPNWGSIAGSQTIFVAYTLGGGQSAGAQWAQAIPQSDGASLVNTSHTVERAGGRVTYYFWVRNETGTPTSFTLSGGGTT